MKVRALLDAYMAHSKATGKHSPASRRYREISFRRFNALHGDEDAEAMKPFHLSDFVEGCPTYRSVSTRRAVAAQIKAAFQWAADGERIPRNPFSRVRYGEAERRPDMPDDFLEFLARNANKQTELALRFIRLTWCRLGEMCAAEWDDFDLEAGVWTMPADKTRGSRQRPKVVALVPEAVELLRGVLAGRLLKAGAVFLNTRGRPWKPGTLGAWLRWFKERHGLEEPATFHGCRHRGATAAIARGAPLKLVAEQLGHATTVTTERYYWNRSAEHIQAIRDAAQAGAPKGQQKA